MAQLSAKWHAEDECYIISIGNRLLISSNYLFAGMGYDGFSPDSLIISMEGGPLDGKQSNGKRLLA